MSKQLAITKDQYTLKSRPISCISIKTARNLEINSLFKISLDRQLPNGLIPLDVLHNMKNKQPQELIIPLLNTANTYIKLLKNTILGSTAKVDNVECIENVSSNTTQSISDKAHDKTQLEQQVKPLLPGFPD